MSAEEIEIHCAECGHPFSAPRSLKGGMTNCPRCGRATTVGGRFELAFWLAVGGAGALIIAISALVYAAAGTGPAIAVLVGGGAILGLILTVL